MHQNPLKTFLIGLLIMLSLLGFTYYKGYKKGYDEAKAEIQADIIMDKKTLKNHGKEIENIRTEPDSSANNRLRKNLRTN